MSQRCSRRAGARGLAALLAWCALLLATEALGAGAHDFGTTGRRNWGRRALPKPATYALELRGGPYLPDVDEAAGGSSLESHFGAHSRFLLGLEVDWQALHLRGIASFGPGFGWGYTRLTGRSFMPDGSKAEARTYLSVMPMYVAAVGRFDYFVQQTSVPLVVYAKLGPALAPWWASNSYQTSEADDGTVGRDISYGWQWAAGVMFLIDWLDPQTAATMESGSGIRHAYLIGEVYGSDLDSFGSSMQVGTTTWAVGVAVEM